MKTAQTQNAGKKNRILVVDDDIHILEFIKLFLHRKNFQVTTLNDGADVVDYVAREHPDLVLLDIMIPLPNGYQICHKLKSQEETKNIPVVLISAKTQKEDIVLGFRAGANHYLKKPFQNEDLLEAIRQLLQPGTH